jgi:hypothetical protein
MIISVEEHSKRMEDSMNRSVTGLKNLETEVMAKLGMGQGHSQGNTLIRGSAMGQKTNGRWQSEAKLQLQSLEERLAALEALVK